jgi:hypothetical protein
MPIVEVDLIGAWWTFDAPTLRVPSPDGTYVSIWSVGAGSSVVSIPPIGSDHSWLVPYLNFLSGRNIVHAIDLREGLRGASDPRLVQDLVAAINATGSALIAGPAELGDAAGAAASRAGVQATVLDLTSPSLGLAS